jgi:hypothetical protein
MKLTSLCNYHKIFTNVVCNNKLECLSLQAFSAWSNVWSLPWNGAPVRCFTWVCSGLTNKIRLDLKGLLGTNTRPYYEHLQNPTAKSLITLRPSLPSRPFQHSLTRARRARANMKKLTLPFKPIIFQTLDNYGNT